MALSGNFSKYPVLNFGLYCEWHAVQNTIGNYSDVTLDIYLSYNAIQVGARSDGVISINGQSENFDTPAIKDSSSGWKKKLLKSKTIRVIHDAAGNASIPLQASWRFDGTYSGVSIGIITASATVSLNKIDRTPPAINIITSDISPNAVTVSASASTICDAWEYSTNNGSNWTQYSILQTTSANKIIVGLYPNTSYAIKVRARKKTNQVYGISNAVTVKTLGQAVLNSVLALTADNSTATITFNWTVFSSAYTYVLKIKNGNATIITIEIPAQTSVGVSNKTITLSAAQRGAILSAMKNIKSFVGTFELTTFNGTNQIGGISEKTAIVQTTSANSAPEFSGFTYKDTNGITAEITANNQLLIKGYSNLSIFPAAANAKNGASIVQYEATINGTTVKSSLPSLTMGAIQAAGKLTLLVKAIDSRGYEKSVSAQITVIEYSDISIKKCIMRRVNEVEEITQVSLESDFFPISINQAAHNTLVSLKYRFKKTSSQTYGEYINATAQANISDSKISLNSDEFVLLDSEYSYDIQFLVQDKLSRCDTVFTLSSGVPLLSKRRKKLGINNRRPKSALDVIGEITQNGVYVLGYVGKIQGNFNNYISGGIFEYLGDEAQNSPGGAGFLEVLAGTEYVMHRFTEFSSGNAVSVRIYNKNSKGWTAWIKKIN